MTRRRRRAHLHQPSLVPMADCLSNVVGVVVFILLFTVLIAGGTVVAKRLPLERKAKGEAVRFVCAGGRIVPFDEQLIVDFWQKQVKPLGEPTYHTVEAWIAELKTMTREDDHFSLRIDGAVRDLDLGMYKEKIPSITAECTPKIERGERVQDLQLETSTLRATLRRHQPDQVYLFFHVDPASLEVFLAARDLALEMGFSAGWTPLEAGEPLRVSLAGGEGEGGCGAMCTTQ